MPLGTDVPGGAIYWGTGIGGQGAVVASGTGAGDIRLPIVTTIITCNITQNSKIINIHFHTSFTLMLIMANLTNTK